MTTLITTSFRNAVRFASASISDIAKESGYAHVTFDKYLNERHPSRGAAVALAAALDKRAERLKTMAERLRQATDEGSV